MIVLYFNHGTFAIGGEKAVRRRPPGGAPAVAMGSCMTRVHVRLALLASASLMAVSAGARAADAPAAADTTPSTVESVVVTAPRQEVVARERQKDALVILNVQSAETIAKYPDFNAAEALSRIPGVSLSSDTGEGRFVNIRGIDANLNGAAYGGVVLLNTNAGGTAAGGGGRAVEFDTLPTGAIDGIVVYKTLSPDREAEGLGGQVDLTPRSAKNIEKPFIEGTLGWGYEPLHSKTGPFNIELAGGARFGFNNGKLVVEGDGQEQPVAAGWISNPTPFSFVLTASRRDDRRAIDDAEEGYIDDTGVAPNAPAGIHGKALSGFDFRKYDYHRRRFGYGGEFDFKPNDNHSYYVRADVAGYIEAAHKNFLLIRGLGGAEDANGNLPAGPGDPNSYADTAKFQQTSTDEQETHRNQVYVLGGKDRFGDLDLDYRASYSRATFAVGYNFGSTFTSQSGIPIVYDNIGNEKHPTFNFGSFNVFDATQYKNTKLSNSSEFDVDEEYAYVANAQIRAHLIGDDDHFKFGLSARLRDKTVNPIAFSGIKPTGQLLSTVSAGLSGYYYNGWFPNGNSISRDVIRSIIGAESGVTSATNQGGYFTAQENVYAGYGMYTANLGPWGLLAGARIEKTQGKYSAYQETVTPTSDTTALTPRSNDYTNVFPTVQVKYSFTPDLIARATYSTGIGRPGFNQLVSSSSVDLTQNPVLISRGNPNLKPVTGTNFDLSLEYYMPAGGILQFGLFDKEFDNYIVQRVNHTTTDILAPGQLATVTTYDNISSAYARGAEIAYHQKFIWLMKPFDGFGVDANITYVDSRILEYPSDISASGRNEYGPLPGTSHVTWNLAAFYEANGLQARLSTEYVSASLFGLSNADRALDTIQDKRFNMDFTSSYTVNRNWSVYFNAKNLLNTPLRYFEGSTNRPIQREFYDVTYEAGVRAKF